MTKNAHGGYREFDPIEVPEDVPELGIRAGDTGTVVDVLSESRAIVEVLDGDGRVLDLIELDLLPTPRVALRWGLGGDEW